MPANDDISVKILHKNTDISLVLGGPLYQFFRKAKLSGPAGEMLWRRIVAVTMVAWLPLPILTLIGGQALHGIKVPFIYDVEAHVRFLIALPVLIAAEVMVHYRLKPGIQGFVAQRIIDPGDMPKFLDAVESARRLRNSNSLEFGLIVLVYVIGVWVWWNGVAVESASWFATPGDSRFSLTLAGYWYAFVSIPIFQFILLRWYARFFIWSRFLWRVSRLKLRLLATHPDRAAGLGFLGLSTYGFGPILFAQGALLAGLIASRVMYEGQDLLSFKMEAGAFVIAFVFLVFSPLFVFAPKLARARRRGLREYERLGARYVDEFHQKWVCGGAPKGEDILGTGDIQSLADLGNSYNVVRETRPVPFAWTDVVRLAVSAAAPLIPLALTVLSLRELVTKLVKIIF